MVGNIIVLFAMRLGASSTFIGTMSAVLYLAFFFLPLGKLLARRFSMIAIFSTAWTCRALGMIPVLFVPLVMVIGRNDLALPLILLGVTLFHVCRGIGMAANNPILSFLASGPDRGSYMTQIQVINSAVGMFSGFAIAMLLGRDPPLLLYVFIIAGGITFGVIAGLMMKKIPGPPMEAEGKHKGLIEVFREAWADPSIRNFIFILFLVALVSGVSRIFLVVYAREVFAQNDGMVSLFSVFGGLGVLMVGLAIKFLVDRIGAKPIFSFCIIIGFVSLIMLIVFPVSMADNFTTLTLYLALLFFIMNFGWLGSEGVMNTYFMGLVPSEKMMDMGILYFFCFGVAGAAGSMLGGVFLDGATALTGSPVVSFRILYIVLALTSAGILLLMRRLVPLGALPFMGALEVMFSYRDLRAIRVLDKLNRSSDSMEETALIEELYNAPSQLATQGLLVRARSPRFSVRMESIRAISALEILSNDAERALMDDMINNPYTTAYYSARALGNHGVFSAIPLLRELVFSDDYMLAGESMIALAKLRDTGIYQQVEQIVRENRNPRLKIAGVEALAIFGAPESINLLMEILRSDDPPPYLLDEVILSMSSILDIQSEFYPLYIRYLADESLVSALAADEAEAAYEFYRSIHGRKRNESKPNLKALAEAAASLQGAVSDYVVQSDGTALSKWILDINPDLVHGEIQPILAEAILAPEFISFAPLKLLLVHWSAHELRLWTNRLRGER